MRYQGFAKVILELDVKNIVDDVNHSSDDLLEFRFIVQSRINLLSLQSDFLVRFVKPQVNECLILF